MEELVETTPNMVVTRVLAEAVVVVDVMTTMEKLVVTVVTESST